MVKCLHSYSRHSNFGGHRSDISSFAGDLERLAKDLTEVKATAVWFARGKQ